MTSTTTRPGPRGTRSSDGSPTELETVLATGGVRTVFQPIVHLGTADVVAYEALSRGPAGALETPDALFGAAVREGRLAELDAACRRSAFAAAVAAGLVAPHAVFVNVEPAVLDTARFDELLEISGTAPGELRVFLEITERAVSARPAELLRTVERVRDAGWGLALDDVGVEAESLAFMALLRPDVVKLDMSLVQQRPDRNTAEVMHAVNAYAERSGALVLAEGIETDAHLDSALSLGASLGQGWRFGRPTSSPTVSPPGDRLALRPSPGTTSWLDTSPFATLPPGTELRQSSKRLLIELSKQLEREAARLGDTCVVAATFQEARHFTELTAGRYQELVERTAFVCALGEGLPPEPLPGLRGASLDPDDPVRGEWDLVVLSPHFCTALLARDLGDDGPDLDRRFEYALTYRRDVVVDAAQALLARVAPRIIGS
ncbi:EAL domain-containing protein [Nocardioides sp.]|uniref:sensor domain-containing phosphodiesterase n=1 Tax=Nocardioides sp. TaxID=35761 RepID=UPI001A2CC62A|nr:EAL domain-containing protein [Nocardioides sp.]MBJ7358342.1 EAL domain-containing protein [Nocardioides sp.]